MCSTHVRTRPNWRESEEEIQFTISQALLAFIDDRKTKILRDQRD